MIIPIRCFTCGAPIGEAYEIFKERVANGEEPAEVLNSLGITRYCCRRMLISHVDLVKEVAPFG